MRRGAAIAAIGLLALAVGVARAGEKKVVRVWHTETEPQTVAAMQEIANDFEKLHPDINIRQEGLAWGDLEAKLTAALAAGAPPDASHGQAFTCASFYHKGLLRDQEDIANAIGKDNIFEVARNLCRFDGKYYGVTHSPNTNLLIYRKDIFKAEGIEAAGDLGRLHQGGPGHDGAGCHRPGDPLRPVPPGRRRSSSTSWWRS